MSVRNSIRGWFENRRRAGSFTGAGDLPAAGGAAAALGGDEDTPAEDGAAVGAGAGPAGIPPAQLQAAMLASARRPEPRGLFRRGSKPISPSLRLLLAARDGDRAAALGMLKAGVPVDVPGANAWTALHFACDRGDLDLVKLLLMYGASVASRSEHEETPLHLAADVGSYEVVHTMIRAGADVNAPDANGITPLLLAIKRENYDIAQFLISNGARLHDRQHGTGHTALHFAAFQGSPDMCQLLLDSGASINFTDNFANTAGHVAAAAGHVLLFDLLLPRGLNIFLCNIDGMTAPQVSFRKGDYKAGHAIQMRRNWHARYPILRMISLLRKGRARPLLPVATSRSESKQSPVAEFLARQRAVSLATPDAAPASERGALRRRWSEAPMPEPAAMAPSPVTAAAGGAVAVDAAPAVAPDHPLFTSSLMFMAQVSPDIVLTIMSYL